MSSQNNKKDSLATIKNVLLKDELTQLNQLLKDTGDKDKKLDELTDIIAEAIARRAARDNAIATSLTPILERSLANAIRKDPKMMADAIFPIIGPAIRRSVVEMLNDLLEQINRVARQNIFNKIRWKIIAKRSGKSYAEVVFSQTLEYQVEQVFLIHNPTGALLLHTSLKEEGSQDADLVSSMLTAINNFVEDSFQSGGIEQIKLDELTLMIKAGPLAHLAILIRGKPNSALVSEKLNETIETIHLLHGNDLAHFNGNLDIYQESLYLLKDCLLSSGKGRQTKQRSDLKRPLQVAGIITLLLLLIFIPQYINGKILAEAQQEYISVLEQNSAVSVISTQQIDNNLVINVLAEPAYYDAIEQIERPKNTLLKPHFVNLLKSTNTTRQ